MDKERYAGLKYLISYESLDQADIFSIAHGCGPGSGWKEKIVPDRYKIIGLDLTPSCEIHDLDYYFQIGKKAADLRFYENNFILASRCFFLFRPFAQHIGFLYYIFVKNCGDKAYTNAGKELTNANYKGNQNKS